MVIICDIEKNYRIDLRGQGWDTLLPQLWKGLYKSLQIGISERKGIFGYQEWSQPRFPPGQRGQITAIVSQYIPYFDPDGFAHLWNGPILVAF